MKIHLVLCSCVVMVAGVVETSHGESLEEIEIQLSKAGAQVKSLKAQVITAYSGAMVSRAGTLAEIQTATGRKSRVSLSTVAGEIHADARRPAKKKTNRAAQDKKDEYLDNGYVAVKTDFSLGYLLSGIANRALGRDQEASDNYHEVEKIDPKLKPVTDRLLSKQYNTVVVVDCGLGPVKTGEDFIDTHDGTVYNGLLVRFRPHKDWESSEESLHVQTSDGTKFDIPIACDLNEMASDHLWTSLEDLRVLKARVAGVLHKWAQGIHQQDIYSQAGKLVLQGLALAELMSARPDLRYCDLMPQRVYLVPLTIAQVNTSVEFRLSGQTGALLTLSDIKPPKVGEIHLIYVRVPPGTNATKTEIGRQRATREQHARHNMADQNTTASNERVR